MPISPGQRAAEFEEFITALRAIDGLIEKTNERFYFRSRAFLHFHGSEAGRCVDVRLGDDWVRRPAETKVEMRALAAEVAAYVEANRPVRGKR